MITHPNVINPFLDERFPFLSGGDNDQKIERPTEHPIPFKLEQLMLLWNKIHSFSLNMTARTIGSGPRQFVEKQLKRCMMPLGEITPDVRNLGDHGAIPIVGYGNWEKYPCVVMDYPVFITPRSSSSSSLFVAGLSQRKWGEVMINLGRAKLDLTDGNFTKPTEAKFRPQMACFINEQTRSYANPDNPYEEKTQVGAITVLGVEKQYLGYIPIYGFPDGGYTISGILKANGYFSEFRVETTTPILVPPRKYKLPPIRDWSDPQSVIFVRQIIVSYPTNKQFIDYKDYLFRIYAGPLKGALASKESIIGDRAYVSITFPDFGVDEWSGPITLAKADMDDWFLTDAQVHLPTTRPTS